MCSTIIERPDNSAIHSKTKPVLSVVEGYDLRLRMVKSAIEIGVKPTAKLFATTPKTVRKWLNRYRQERLAGLNELPRIPLICPHKTPSDLERKIVDLRKQYPFMGVKRLKYEHNSCYVANYFAE